MPQRNLAWIRSKLGGKKEYYFDYSLLFVVLFLIGFGLVMVYSTSSYTASISKDCGYDSFFYLKKQMFASILGVAAMMLVAHFVKIVWFEKLSLFIYVGSLGSLLLLLTPLAVTANGAKRWVRIGISIQPAELSKLGCIVLIAAVICKMGKGVRTLKGSAVVMGIAFIQAAIVFGVSSDLSSAVIIMGIAFLMLFVANPNYKGFIITALILAAIVAIFVLATVKSGESGSFRGMRILAWRNPEKYAQSYGYQTIQALYAIGSGGMFGKGIGESMQKLGFIPEAQNDMIFSVVCEELGLFGAIAIIVLFAILIWRCMIIASNAKNLYNALTVVGIMSQIAIQVILNIAVVTNTVPNTGISLPFISYGGSSVVILLVEIGMVLNIARNIELKEIG